MWATHACRTFEMCWLFDCNSNCNRFIFNDIIFRFEHEHETEQKTRKKTIIIIALLLQLVLSTSVIYRDSTKSHRNSYIVQSLFSSYYLFVHCPLFALVIKVQLDKKFTPLWNELCSSRCRLWIIQQKKNGEKIPWKHFKQLRVLVYQENSH